ncbi:stage III sporulation protein AB [Alicyclobacillus cellulosilyticus]|uniref:Stage III sporulation protein AB n=1 Tax=Alicyclobacillus cellulosilyticus TaxID=1003997 RepID=A0A917K2B6_9BACL|nr:stage III sporulation protein SpoIIIAB [Alicyclobacillus cellulosilyticus]GGI95985.1 stage III sporulation protein AB [Alicyclobacillus cellulosilyticus]
MVRLLGAALIMVACTGIGFRIARDYRERPRQLRGLMHALRVLQTEIEYTATPLPQALERVARRAPAPVKVLFETAAEGLRDPQQTLDTAFQAGMAALDAQSALRKQDYDVLWEFGRTLGTSDRLHQTQHIAATLEHLAALEREARDLQRRNERLWQYLGVLTGIALLILLS